MKDWDSLEITKTRYRELKKMVRFISAPMDQVYEVEGMIKKSYVLLEKHTCVLWENSVSKKYYYEER